MKKAVLVSVMGAAGLLAATAAQAEEVGRVISSTPVIQQVAVPRQTCAQQYMQPQSSGGGAIVGAIVGGLLGNTVGGGMGRAAATGVGAVAGAAIGDRVEANGQPQYAQNCSTQTYYENRTVGYNVQYEYAGQQYNVQMPYDPGQTIRLQVTPVTTGAQVDNSMQQPQQQQPMSQQPAAVILTSNAYQPYGYAYPAYGYPAYGYPAYYPYYRPWYPPVSLSLGFGWVGGGGHRHWR